MIGAYLHNFELLSPLLIFQVLPYDVLMQELDVTNVRELEDFLISECMYVVCILNQYSGTVN